VIAVMMQIMLWGLVLLFGFLWWSRKQGRTKTRKS
jgi:hypothetical protein